MKIGDRIQVMPGCNAVFRGQYSFGCPVYEVEAPPLIDDVAFLCRLPERPNEPTIDWLASEEDQ